MGWQQVRKNRTAHEVRITCPCPETTPVTLAVTCSCFMLSIWVSPQFQKGMEHHKQTLTRNLRPGYTLSISPLKQAHSDSLSNSCIQGTNNSPGVGHRIRPTGKKTQNTWNLKTAQKWTGKILHPFTRHKHCSHGLCLQNKQPGLPALIPRILKH